MKPLIGVIIATAAVAAHAATVDRNVATGRTYYDHMNYRKAAATFSAACKQNDAGACFQAGVSYETLADIRTPFGCQANAKARQYFRRAFTLAADDRLYRNALFESLVDSADCAPSALREAAKIVAETPPSDPDYDMMHRRLENENRLTGTLGARAGRLFMAPPRIASWLGLFGR